MLGAGAPALLLRWAGLGWREERRSVVAGGAPPPVRGSLRTALCGDGGRDRGDAARCCRRSEIRGAAVCIFMMGEKPRLAEQSSVGERNSSTMKFAGDERAVRIAFGRLGEHVAMTGKNATNFFARSSLR